MKYNLIALSLIFVVNQVLSQDNFEDVETTVSVPVLKEKGIGHELYKEVATIFPLIKQRKYDSAMSKIKDTMSEYEDLINDNRVFYCFQSKSEYTEFINKHKDSQIQWVNWGYKECLQLKAFIKASLNDYDEASNILDRLGKIAPMSAQVYIEKGYVLTRMGKMQEALKSYLKATKLTKEYKTQESLQAPALRGLGFVYIELKELDKAEKLFNQSLKLDPENKIALNELRYIEGLREKE